MAWKKTFVSVVAVCAVLMLVLSAFVPLKSYTAQFTVPTVIYRYVSQADVSNVTDNPSLDPPGIGLSRALYQNAAHALTAARGFVVRTDVGPQCGPNQTALQTSYPRKPRTLREFSCQPLPRDVSAGIPCVPEGEFRSYTGTNVSSKRLPPSLDMYQSRCWCITRGTAAVRSVVCIPTVYMMGFSKCGTSDLRSNLWRHPLVERADGNEQSFWPYEGKSVLSYTGMFRKAIQGITRWCVKDSEAEYHPRLVVDDSPRAICTLATQNAIHNLVPSARVIVSVRNPTDRLYSFYFHLIKTVNKGPRDFHDRVVSTLTTLRSCIASQGEEVCVNDRKRGLQIRLGLYVVYLERLFKIFPREQIYINNLHDYARDRIGTLERVFSFLGLESPPSNVYGDLESRIINNRHAVYKGNNDKPMLNETRHVLDEFYRPFNRRLACLLGDDRYLWLNPA